MSSNNSSSENEKGGVITRKNVISFALGAAAAALSVVIRHVVNKPRKRTRVVSLHCDITSSSLDKSISSPAPFVLHTTLHFTHLFLLSGWCSPSPVRLYSLPR